MQKSLCLELGLGWTVHVSSAILPAGLSKAPSQVKEVLLGPSFQPLERRDKKETERKRRIRKEKGRDPKVNGHPQKVTCEEKHF